MSDKNTPPKKVASWKLNPDIITMLQMIADDEGESQALMLRDLIKKEFKRRKLSLPSE